MSESFSREQTQQQQGTKRVRSRSPSPSPRPAKDARVADADAVAPAPVPAPVPGRTWRFVYCMVMNLSADVRMRYYVHESRDERRARLIMAEAKKLFTGDDADADLVSDFICSMHLAPERLNDDHMVFEPPIAAALEALDDAGGAGYQTALETWTTYHDWTDVCTLANDGILVYVL